LPRLLPIRSSWSATQNPIEYGGHVPAPEAPARSILAKIDGRLPIASDEAAVLRLAHTVSRRDAHDVQGVQPQRPS